MNTLRRLPLLVMLSFAGAHAAQAQTPNSSPVTTEERNSFGPYRVNAYSAYARGLSGRGVTVGVIDTGILRSHTEFYGRILTGYNAFDGSTNVTDRHGHGTHVAGIIGAGYANPSWRGMFGLAYNVRLLPIKALSDSGGGTTTSAANGILHAARRGAAIINLSLSASGPTLDLEDALRSAVAANMVVAAAAGNYGAAAPDWPARFARETWANGQIISVGAVDRNNVIAGWSNRAGDTKNFHLVAPGTDIYSTYSLRTSSGLVATYATMSGTSMATPLVAGAAALIKSGWSYLSASQIASILFASATDLGAAGVDEVYGHGLLNVQRALQPIGTLSSPTSSGSRVLFSGTSLVSSAASGSALQAAARDGLFGIAAFDTYGRDFSLDLGASVSTKAVVTDPLMPMLAAFDAAAAKTYTHQGTSVRLAYRSGASQAATGYVPFSSSARLPSSGFAFTAMDLAGRELSFGYLGMGAQAFGLAGELARLGEMQLTASLGNPYLSLVERHMHAGLGMPLGAGLRVRFGMLVSDPRSMAQDEWMISSRRQSMTVGEVSGQLRSALWTMGIGRLQESDAVLGATQSGAMGFAADAGTTVLNFGMALSASTRVRLGAQYTVGYTGRLANRSDSLVTGYSAGRSEAYTAFASFREAFRLGDSVTLTVSQPMRIASGVMHMAVPVGADEEGRPVMEARSLSLKPDAREIRTDLLYMAPNGRDSQWFLGLALRQHPNHDASAPRETMVAAGVRASF